MERLRVGYKTKILAAGVLGAAAIGSVGAVDSAMHPNRQPQGLAESFEVNVGLNRDNSFIADLVDVNPPLILLLSGALFAAGASIVFDPRKNKQ